MSELDKAREAAISTFKNKYPRVIGDAPYAPQVVNAFEEGYDAGYATATAKIGRLENVLSQARAAFVLLSDTLEPRSGGNLAREHIAAIDAVIPKDGEL